MTVQSIAQKGRALGRFGMVTSRTCVLTAWDEKQQNHSFRMAFLRAMAIRAGRSTRRAPEHRAKGTNAVVAKIESHLRHWSAISQASHGFEHARLLAPGAEGKAGLALEMPRQRAGAGVERRGPFIQCALIAGASSNARQRARSRGSLGIGS